MADKFMTPLERLQHLRNTVSRLQYVAEKDRHMRLVFRQNSEVADFMCELRESWIPFFQNRKNKHRKGSEVIPPRHLDEMRKALPTLLGKAEGLLSTWSADPLEQEEEESSICYETVQYHLLQEAIEQLREMNFLVASAPLLSRFDNHLLAEGVSHHITDFNAFVSHRLPQYVNDCLKEKCFYSANVMPDSATSQPVGMVSAFVIDVAIGIRPAKHLRPTLEHFSTFVSLLEQRVGDARKVLDAVVDTKLAAEQRKEYDSMILSISKAREFYHNLRKEWEEHEMRFLKRAQEGSDVTFLLADKETNEKHHIEQVQEQHDELAFKCLPFLTPQYHRRYALTYATPCHIRVGLRFYDASQKRFLMMQSLNGQAYDFLFQKGIPPEKWPEYDALLPSKDQIWVSFDEVPEMVKGERCFLNGIDVEDHQRGMEEQREVGAYFVMRGGERILRALLMQRCNVPINIFREKFAVQGPNFSPRAVVFRSKRLSGVTVQNYFYFTTLGEVTFSFARKVVWHIPTSLLLLSLKNVSTVTIFQDLTLGRQHCQAYCARAEAFLQHHRSKPYGALSNMLDFLSVLGRMYRQYQQNSPTYRFIPELGQDVVCHHDAWYGLFMLRRHVMPHLNANVDTPELSEGADVCMWLSEDILCELEAKYHTIIACVRQLYDFVDGQTDHQGNDIPSYQEVFTPSQVMVGAFELCLNRYMRFFIYRLGSHLSERHFKSFISLLDRNDEKALTHLRRYVENVTKRTGGELDLMHKLLVTGNFKLDREEDFYCPQDSGWVVMAEHLNFFRFYEQLRCLHRGKTIAEMRSSEVRKYPLDAYGFICMVHSPDGADCGVLNHMSIGTRVSCSAFPNSSDYRKIRKLIARCIEQNSCVFQNNSALSDKYLDTIPVWVEGRVAGYVLVNEAAKVAESLRKGKMIEQSSIIDITGNVKNSKLSALHTLEVIHVPPQMRDPPGLYVFFENGRLIRPIQKLESEVRNDKAAFLLMYVGTWEQTWLNIASVPSDLFDAKRALNRRYEYMERSGSDIISVTSATIPFFEFNCSPRNLFQCGLSKQSAGTQLQALGWRKEAKLFRMYTPQRYLVRTLPMDEYELDDVSLGVNAVVAVLAYTGYDMDDAVVVNQTAVDRGLFHASITVSKVVDLSEKDKEGSDAVTVFHNLTESGRHCADLDERGLPPRRTYEKSTPLYRDHKFPTLQDNDAVYCFAKRTKVGNGFDYTAHKIFRWKEFDKGEAAWVHAVVPLEYKGPDPTKVLLVFRIPRNPQVGDKFSSRHGQKGTLPLHIRSLDLPFSAKTGISPDVIINPHAFPSRMTVGMVLELLAGKMGAVQGNYCDYSAWNLVDEDTRAADDIGNALVKSGYHRNGREQMICGISGELMEADVFVGVCGYQRLRHMVSDKWQARARTDSHTYKAISKTGQPVKGRKRHGGVRVGEMERDGLLSHGIADVVVDRLLHVSDETKAYVCKSCGGLLGTIEKHAGHFSTVKTCKFCEARPSHKNEDIVLINVPQVLRLWAAELTSIGIRVTLEVK